MKIASLLAQIPDPRSRDCLYTAGEIVFLVLAGICAGEKDLTRIAEWGEDNEKWLKAICRMKPAHRRMTRLFHLQTNSAITRSP